MSNIKDTLTNIKLLTQCNAKHQPLDFLQCARSRTDGWEIIQGESTIRLHHDETLHMLMLWYPSGIETPMDNVKPQWDLPIQAQAWLNLYDTFPQAILLGTDEWESPWLATTWWPIDGVTDGIDNPEAWLKWWWFTIMEGSSENRPTLTDLQMEVLLEQMM